MVANSGMTNNRFLPTQEGQVGGGILTSPSALQEVALGGELVANDPVQAQVRETKIDINGKLMTILWANQLPIVGSLFAKLPHSDNVSMLRQARQIKMLEFDAQGGHAANDDNYALAAISR